MSIADIVIVIFLLVIIIVGGIGLFLCLCKLIVDAINDSHDWEERG